MIGSQPPLGVDFLWRVLTEVSDEEISRAVIDELLSIYYLNLEPKLKRDPASLHNKFYNECYQRLEVRLRAVHDRRSLHWWGLCIIEVYFWKWIVAYRLPCIIGITVDFQA